MKLRLDRYDGLNREGLERFDGWGCYIVYSLISIDAELLLLERVIECTHRGCPSSHLTTQAERRF